MANRPYTEADLFCEENSVHDVVQVMRRKICLHKQLEVNSNVSLSTLDYLELLQRLTNQFDTESMHIMRVAFNLSASCYETFNFQWDNKPWDPYTMEPFHEISRAYVASCQYYKKSFKKLINFSPSTTVYAHSTSTSVTSKKNSKCTTTNQDVPNIKKNKPKVKKAGKSMKKKSSMPKTINLTSENNNPFDGTCVCFKVDGDMGQKLLEHFKIDTFPDEAIESVCEKKYIFGVVTDRVPKSVDLYTVVWNYTGLRPMNMSGSYIVSANAMFNSVKPKLDKMKHQKILDVFFSKKDNGDEGDPLDSDCEADDIDEYDEEFNKVLKEEIDNIRLKKDTLRTRITSKSRGEKEEIDGVTWEKDGDMCDPIGKSNLGKSKIKSEYKDNFKTELDSFLSFVPMVVWEKCLIESNRKAHQEMKANKNDLISGKPWTSDITLQELMTFYGILILSTLDPIPGRELYHLWKHPDKYEYTKYQKYLRFCQIKSVLHFSNNEEETNSDDALYKVRPLLNILKKTLGLYLDVGDEFALDESSCASKSKYGRALIFFNPTKPTGKYHFRFYLLCCSTTYNVLRLRVHTRNTSDVADGLNPDMDNHDCVDEVVYTDDGTDVMDNENNNDVDDADVSRTNAIILDMAEPFYGSGRTLTMDNYYGGVVPIVKLRRNGVFSRCTFRMDRKHTCKFVRMTKRDSRLYSRGSYKVAVAEKEGIVAVGWLDGNPVHMLTTADGTGTTTVERQVKQEKIPFQAPRCIPRYNKTMQAVDRLDQLLRLFSLTKRHSLKKWYKQFSLALLDFAIANADIHFHMNNPTLKAAKEHRFNFMEKLGKAMLESDWHDMYRKHNKQTTTTSSKNEQTKENDLLVSCLGIKTSDGTDDIRDNSLGSVSSASVCAPVKCDSTVGKRGQVCQICLFEGRGRFSKDVFLCETHKVRACLRKLPDHTVKGMFNDVIKGKRVKCQDWSWICPNRDLSCWDKFHTYYLPKGLFKIQEISTPNETKHKAVLRKGHELLKKQKKALYGIDLNGLEDVQVPVPSIEVNDGGTTSASNSDNDDDVMSL